MSRLPGYVQALSLTLLLLALAGCQKIFGEFVIDDSAFRGPTLVTPVKDLVTTEWGGQATFTIVLKQIPKGEVKIPISSSNTNEGTVSPNSVTFNADDWNAPQVVTITGVDDTAPDGNKSYTIITGAVVSPDPAFSGKNPADVSVTNIDNETAGITVVPKSGLVTSEAGAQDTFTVVLNSKPNNDVTVSLVSDKPNEGTVSPKELLFTPINWMAPQLVTVTGVDDDAKDSNQPYQIKVTTKSDDPNYARVAPVSVAVTNLDNESAGVSVELLSGVDTVDPNMLRTNESGDTATFSVVLNAPPQSDVTFDVSSDTPGEGTVTPASLTFTKDNWNAPQIVTVTGVNDDKADGDQLYQVKLSPPITEDLDYQALAEGDLKYGIDVPVRNVDNDKPNFTVKLLTGIDPQNPNQLLTSEDGTTATFSLVLNSAPSADVTVKLSSGAPTEAAVLPETLTFTPNNWNAPQVVSVTGLNDDIEDGSPQFYVITGAASSEDTGYGGIDPPDVQVTNQDNDTAGLTVTLVKGIDPTAPNKLITEENGATATFTIALTSKPTSDVTIPFSNSNTKEGTLWASSLKFTPDNYSAPQTVTIAGVDDKIVDGNQPYIISIGPADSDDTHYKGKFASQVQLTNIDDDSAGVLVAPLSGLTTSENSGTATFTIRLQSQPKSDVTIGISSSNPAEGRPNVNSVKFTPLNWNANQTVTVTGQEDDGVQDGNQSYKIVLDVTQSDDPSYNGTIDPLDVSLTNTDNDSAGFVVTPTAGLVTTEGGGKATFTIALTSKPVNPVNPTATTNVKFSLSSSKPTEGSVSPTNLTFTDTNWRSPQTVTVTGINDDVADGNQPYLIVMGTASSTDPNYNNHKASDVSVENKDDDSASVVITPIPTMTPTSTTEKGGTATFTVALSSLPTADVTFMVTSLDSTEGAVSPSTLKFTATNGKTPQTVTVTGLDDSMADGNQQYTVRLGNGSSSDPNYNNKFATDLLFVNIDDDVPGLDVQAGDLTTTEHNSGTATFTVGLKSQPTADVTIGVSSNNTDEGTVSPSSLKFTTNNWSTAQTVTITGVDDDVADGNQTYRVRLANASSSDANYNNKFGQQLDVTNVDDDQPGYDVSSPSASQTTEKGGQVTFTVALRSKPAGTSTVTLGVSSSDSNEASVSPSSLVFTGDDWAQPHTVTVTGLDDKKADKDVGYEIRFAGDVDYKGGTPSPIPLTNLDDDTLGVIVTSAGCATTPGTTATFTIVLNSQPTANVTIALSSDTPTAGAVSPDSVTFTNSGTGAWDVPQTVTVTGQNDGSAGMMTPYTIITANASAPGELTGYNGYQMIADVSCTNTAP